MSGAGGGGPSGGSAGQEERWCGESERGGECERGGGVECEAVARRSDRDGGREGHAVGACERCGGVEGADPSERVQYEWIPVPTAPDDLPVVPDGSRADAEAGGSWISGGFLRVGAAVAAACRRRWSAACERDLLAGIAGDGVRGERGVHAEPVGDGEGVESADLHPVAERCVARGGVGGGQLSLRGREECE